MTNQNLYFSVTPIEEMIVSQMSSLEIKIFFYMLQTIIIIMATPMQKQVMEMSYGNILSSSIYVLPIVMYSLISKNFIRISDLLSYMVIIIFILEVNDMFVKTIITFMMSISKRSLIYQQAQFPGRHQYLSIRKPSKKYLLYMDTRVISSMTSFG